MITIQMHVMPLNEYQEMKSRLAKAEQALELATKTNSRLSAVNEKLVEELKRLTGILKRNGYATDHSDSVLKLADEMGDSK